MNRYRWALLVLLLLPAVLMAQNPRVLMETDRGPIFIELDPEAAPVTSQNFLDYVDAGFFDGLIFHRVIEDFVVQGGGFTRDYELRDPTQPNIVNEGDNGLLNTARTIAMARQTDLDSANSQFYFNLVHNDFLDGTYAVFGDVIGGWTTVEEISRLATATQPTPIGNFQDSPLTPPYIRRAYQFTDYPIQAVHSGSWFDPNNAGVGFNIEVTNQGGEADEPVLIVYWYDFSSGNQIWLTGISGFQWGDSEVSVDLLGVVTPDESVDFQMPPAGEAYMSRGTISLRFDDCFTGQFSYNLPDFGAGTVDVQRLSVPDRVQCDRYQFDD